MKIVLISGKARHGKDTVAAFIRQKLTSEGKKVLVTHYADLLKFICTNYFGWDGEKDDNGRHLLQYVGTDVVRKQNPDLWVDFVALMLTYFSSNWDYVLIPDCRFPNEITKMKDVFKDTIHLRVVRTNLDSDLSEEQQNHSSEVALDDFEADTYIYNDGSYDELYEKVLDWVGCELYG